MGWGRVLASAAASAAVVGTAFVAVGMSRAATEADSPDATRFVMPTLRLSPHTAPPPVTSVPVVPVPAAPPSRSRAATPPATAAVPNSAAPSTSPRPTPRATTAHRAPANPPPSTSARPSPPAANPGPAAARGQRLPLSYPTGSATRVITVVAPWTGSTTATLQAWTKAPGGGWLRFGSPVPAYVGSQGVTPYASESKSATPMGSFTLTQAFGYLSNPGTRLPYFRTTPDDWWIGDSGPYYNTHRRCSTCGYERSGKNEHLYYITPYYNYAVVIDYNTPNSPTGVRQGAGSAFFLHVTDGAPTAGCVAIPQNTLLWLMRWLTPTAHPRILIGTA